MPTIEVLTERIEPVSPETLGEAVLARFEREPDTLAIPVVSDGRPVGLIERDAFLIKFSAEYGRQVFGQRPIAWVMDDEPVVIEASTHIDSICGSMLSERASSLLRGFIVTEGGQYVGVGTAVGLLQASVRRERIKADDAAREIDRLSDAHVQAQAAAQSRTRFLSVLSHELRTPMNGVTAMAELLQRQPLNADAQAYVQTIRESAETLLRTLEDAMDLSRAEAGDLSLNAAPAMIREIMDSVQETWQSRAVQDGVTLLVSYEGDTELAALIDADRLRQVFNTLVGNALKFTRQGVVEAGLKAWLEAGTVCLEARVRDSGEALDAERLAALMGTATLDGDVQAGLGLSISRHLVTRLGGTLRAESNGGHGTTFTFDLAAPQAVIESEAESNVSEIAGLQLQAQPHILIVDDNATNRVVAQALCEMFGCTSECAEDGVEAVEAVSSRPFDMVLMDIKMPRMDGVQATKAIRALPGPACAVPIVALTANADPDDAKGYIAIGMAAVVEKPIKPDRLRHAMNAALAASEADEAEGTSPISAVA